MTPVERITAAIAKLEQLKADSSKGPWTIAAQRETFDPRFDDTRIVDCRDVSIFRDGSYAMDPGGMSEGDAQLIVTLHRTIDTQLAILRSGLANAGYGDQVIDLYALDLADAILGEST